jgi:uncharacterized protein
MEKIDVEFPADDGITLRGFLFLPEGSPGPHPAIAMAVGMAGVITAGPSHVVARMVESEPSYAMLFYDARTRGRSDGEPRWDIDPAREQEDVSAALAYLESRDDVDGDRLGLWGTSYGGSHVFVVAAFDPRVKAVVSQVPVIDGHDMLMQMGGFGNISAVRRLIADKRREVQQGAVSPRLRMVLSDPADQEEGEFILQPGRRTWEYANSGPWGPSEGWMDTATFLSLERFLKLDVRGVMDKISPVPLMMIITSGDELTPTASSLRAFELALEPKKLVLVPGDHYGADLPGPGLDMAVQAAIGWFEAHL